MARTKASVSRRRFLKGAAVGAAALVAKSTPIAGAAQEPAAARPGAPAAPGAVQLRADTEPPPRGASARLVEKPASDFMVDVIKTLGIEYVAANPGSSFEGLHESIINYGDNRMPELLTCCHEESSVAMAHGYAKIEGKPMLARRARQHRAAARVHGDLQRVRRSRARDDHRGQLARRRHARQRRQFLPQRPGHGAHRPRLREVGR